MPTSLAARICAATSSAEYGIGQLKFWIHGTTRQSVPSTCRLKSSNERFTIAYGSLTGEDTEYSPLPQCDG
jgi:hypothetical protein